MIAKRPTPSTYGVCLNCTKRGVRWVGATLRSCKFCGWTRSGVER